MELSAVLCQSQPMEVLPELISQLLLVKMKEVAEGILQAPLDGAVITVPAYFQEPQRQATKMAAQEAGIKVQSQLNIYWKNTHRENLSLKARARL